MSAPGAWNPAQYERFKQERAQPFWDLLALVRPARGARVVDLGCGTGELTAELHRRLGAARTVGIDNSAEMLAKSVAHAGREISFEQADIGDFLAAARNRGEWDLVFSNAALQWLGGHEALFARLHAAIAPGGQLALQMPANQASATHVVAGELAAEEPFAAKMAGPAQSGILPPSEYALLLHRLGFREQHVRVQIYGHVLASRDDAIEWVKGTLLTGYQQQLGELFPAFLQRYRERLLSRLADERPFFFPFPRVLLWALK